MGVTVIEGVCDSAADSLGLLVIEGETEGLDVLEIVLERL